MALTPTTKLKTSGGTLSGQLNFSGTTHAGLKLLSLTTVQRDALTPANGMLIYNTTTATVQKYEAGAWSDVGSGGSGNGGYSLTASTSDATQTELLTAEAARLTLPDNTAWGFTALFTGRYNGNGSPVFNTWTARAGSALWNGIASSSDGTKLAAVVYNGSIATSTDSGVNWTGQASGNRGWQSITSSSDGTKLAATTETQQIYTSTDSGVSWTARDNNRNWYGIASSSDGTKLVAGVYGGQIYTSTDSGVSWTARDSSRDWWGIASSSDGTKLAATNFNGQIYTSSNSGVDWTAQASGVLSWMGISSSSDGAILAAVADYAQIYTSTDSGVTWSAVESNRRWQSIASSADGTKLAAVGISIEIYTSTSAVASAASETCEFKGHAVRDSGAASMSISALQENPIGTNTAGRFVCQADTTNGALQFLATGAASETWKWGVSIQTVEVTP